MSTQLILYPQDYQGYSYNTQVNTGNFASNSFFTSNLTNEGSIYGIGQVVDFGQNVIGLSAYSSGGWTGFHSDTTGADWNTIASPDIFGGVLKVYAQMQGTQFGSACGVAQEITGLTIGASYELKWSHTQHAGKINWWVGSIGVGNGDFIGNNGTVFQTQIANANTSQSFIFTASATSMPLLLTAVGTAAFVACDITSIEVIGTVSEIHTVAEGDGQVICDLYEEEDIPLTLNVDNFKNAIEKPQSYSKSFDLPNTKRNAKIFTHIFDITKTIETVYDFNPHNQTRAVLKQDGVMIFEGTLRLIDIKDKEGEISYNVNLYASSIALKEVLSDRTFADLTQAFTELQHSYNFTNIDNSWNDILDLTNTLPADSFAGSGTTTDVLKYPFVDWGGMINCTGSTPDVNVLEQAFRPCISVLYIIRNIFRQAGFEYTSYFFDTDADFANLYMDFNWGSNNAPDSWSNTSLLEFTTTTTIWTGTSDTIAQFPDGSPPSPNLGWDDATNTFTCLQDSTMYSFWTDCTFYNPTSDSPTLEVWWEKNSTPVAATYQTHTFSGSGKFTYIQQDPNLILVLADGDTLKLVSKASALNKVKQYGSGFGYGDNFFSIVSAANNDDMVRGTLVNTLRGELGQWDFFKSIMTTFNLVSMPDPDDSTKILIEPYPDVFGQAAKVGFTTRDWTYKLDTKDIKLEPLELKKEIIFKYSEDDDDYAFNVYKTAASGYLYGSLTLDGTSLLGSQASLLTGEEVIEPKSFAATICKPIQDSFPNFIIPVIYSSVDDGTFEGFENMPRILLWNGIATDTWECPGQNGVAGGTKTEYGQMTHVSSVPSTSSDADMNFGACSTFVGSPVNNLYNLYYSEYFDELYNPNTRILTAKINLSASDINTFRFYDKVILKNRKFRVNKINYKPNSLSTVEFILIP